MELNKLTKMYIEEIKKPPTDDGMITEALPALGAILDPPNVRIMSARNIKYFSHWIEA